jgi:hypothetical protein
VVLRAQAAVFLVVPAQATTHRASYICITAETVAVITQLRPARGSGWHCTRAGRPV